MWWESARVPAPVRWRDARRWQGCVAAKGSRDQHTRSERERGVGHEVIPSLFMWHFYFPFPSPHISGEGSTRAPCLDEFEGAGEKDGEGVSSKKEAGEKRECESRAKWGQPGERRDVQ